jgi:hypothetical protein
VFPVRYGLDVVLRGVRVRTRNVTLPLRCEESGMVTDSGRPQSA